jgi:hypothetical protein
MSNSHASLINGAFRTAPWDIRKRFSHIYERNTLFSAKVQWDNKIARARERPAQDMIQQLSAMQSKIMCFSVSVVPLRVGDETL